MQPEMFILLDSSSKLQILIQDLGFIILQLLEQGQMFLFPSLTTMEILSGPNNLGASVIFTWEVMILPLMQQVMSIQRVISTAYQILILVQVFITLLRLLLQIFLFLNLITM